MPLRNNIYYEHVLYRVRVPPDCGRGSDHPSLRCVYREKTKVMKKLFLRGLLRIREDGKEIYAFG